MTIAAIWAQRFPIARNVRLSRRGEANVIFVYRGGLPPKSTSSASKAKKEAANRNAQISHQFLLLRLTGDSSESRLPSPLPLSSAFDD
ncbi:unnamed protein product [Linum trigynum]|uniref:Uncharacterized protein n=1 Tax=Linum trigynum TaxID=586398 RepID=A0AAV2DJ70_9ROSI